MPSIKRIISVIGSGDLPSDHPSCKKAYLLGKALIDNGYRLVTGGYGGVMEAASKGARDSGNHKEGDIIGILRGMDRNEGNPYLDVPLTTGFGMARNQIVASSDCVVAISGSGGTLSEMAFAWGLGRMVIAYRVEGWSGELADGRIDDRKRNALTDDRVYGADDESDVIKLIGERLHHYL